ncbi:hypothetical protein F5Y16DRAFT_407943 [Xylariaceae sp. FL0255]|nr:hypothetical protein F5Y16DRAFT_407943 [Xylariaceae sp. FL0255]
MLNLFARRLRHVHAATRLSAGSPELRWDGNVREFVPRRGFSERQVETWPLAANTSQLRRKILQANGFYTMVRDDLISMYGMSTTEARHAMRQLERLLSGRSRRHETTTERLDDYLAWKRDVVPLFNADDHLPPNMDQAPATEGPLPQNKWKHLWPQLVFSDLGATSSALPPLEPSTFEPSHCPSYVFEDVMYLLHRRHQKALNQKHLESAKQIHQEMVTLAFSVLEKCPPRYLGFDQSVLRAISRARSTSELAKLLQLLKATEHPLHANTLLHFASHFAKTPGTKTDAVAILHSLVNTPGFDINSPAAASVCTSLLTLNENEPLPSDDAAPDVLFGFLLEQGLQPNLLGLSALMRNFCLRGHLDAAWKILDIILQHRLEPDLHVYSILLNGSKELMDVDSTEQIVGIIKSRQAWSTVLVNDLLDILYRDNEWQPEPRRRQRKKKNNAWRAMFPLYSKFYYSKPLQRLTRFPLENLLVTWSVKPEFATPFTRIAEALEPQPDHKLIQPDSNTLCLMLAAHMRSIQRPKHILLYHAYFWDLVKKGDPIATSLLKDQGTRVFNIFLRSLLQFKQTIGFAVRNVQKLIALADDEYARHGRHILYHPPSAHTWTILLNGFKNHREMRSAISVFDTMSKHTHTQPTLATWNALIQLLARKQDVAGAIKAMTSLEKAGYQPDDRTVKALALMPRNLRDRAIAMLEKRRKAAGASREAPRSLDIPHQERPEAPAKRD